MKKFNLMILLLAVMSAAIAQKPINQSVDGSDNLLRYSASPGGGGFGLTIGIDKNTKWIEYHNMIANQPFGNYVFLNGTKTITLFGYIPKDSLSYFRYNIVENDNKMLVTDATPAIRVKLPVSGQGQITELNLGQLDVSNKKLTIETYKITDRTHVATTTIYNKEIVPAKIFWVARSGSNKKGDFVFMERMPDGFKFKTADSGATITALNVIIKPTDINFIYSVSVKNLSTGQTVPVSNNWQYDYFMESAPRTMQLPYLRISSSFFQTPGDYEVQIIPKLPGGFVIRSFPEKMVKFHFTVLPSDKVYQKKDVILLLIITVAVVALLALIGFLIIKRRNKKRLAEQQQQKDMAQLQLEAVRSQLNPHFLFNALSGIQNLINKTETDQANRYLTKFARLTRNVLNNHDLIDLAEEKALLDDYLQMEQMRFGFSYEINIGPGLDAANIKIPSMLLQPFVENAVKYGLTEPADRAMISINFSKNKGDIELSIADNGKGFDTNKQSAGLGIQLSKKRIALLNTIYKDSPITLDIKPGEGGTVVRITLTHWL